MRPAGIVAGVGFRHAAQAEEIIALIRGALASAGLPPERLCALATAVDRADEPAIRDAAETFGLRPIGMPPEALKRVDAAVPTRSERIESTRGVGSLAEAAALAAAGEGAELVLSRITSGNVTCALARRRETP